MGRVRDTATELESFENGIVERLGC